MLTKGTEHAPLGKCLLEAREEKGRGQSEGEGNTVGLWGQKEERVLALLSQLMNSFYFISILFPIKSIL